MDVAAKSFAIESEQHELRCRLCRARGGRHENIGLFRAGVFVIVGFRLELHGGIHFRAQVGIGLQNLNLDLDGRFLPVRFGRHFGDLAFVGAIFEGVESDDAFLLGRQLGEVILRDIEFDLNVVQVGERDYRSARAAFGAAGELRGDEFSFFRRALENRAGDRSANHGRVELRLGVGHLAFGLQQVAPGALNLFGARAELHELESALQRIHSLLRSVVLGDGVVQILLGHALPARPDRGCGRD